MEKFYTGQGYIVEIYNKLKKTRKDRGVTLNDLEAETGIPRASISAYENGKRGMPRQRLELIAGCLGVEVSEISTVNPQDVQEEGVENMIAGSKDSMPPTIKTSTLKLFLEASIKAEDYEAARIISTEITKRENGN